jgi:hypothetical protein
MNLVIQTVSDDTRTWDGPNGTIEFLSGMFTDGSDWSLGCKPENVEARKAELKALIGQDGDFELEAKPEYQGRVQWKLKSWPGKPSFGSSGGSKTAGGSWYNSEVGVHFTQERMDRRTALMQAATVVGRDVDILAYADSYYAWLRKTSGTPTTAPDMAGGGLGTPVQNPPASTSQPEQTLDGRGWAPAEEVGSAAHGEGAGDLTSEAVNSGLHPVHVHSWTAAPKAGWSLCTECGKAEKTSRT